MEASRRLRLAKVSSWSLGDSGRDETVGCDGATRLLCALRIGESRSSRRSALCSPSYRFSHTPRALRSPSAASQVGKPKPRRTAATPRPASRASTTSAPSRRRCDSFVAWRPAARFAVRPRACLRTHASWNHATYFPERRVDERRAAAEPGGPRRHVPSLPRQRCVDARSGRAWAGGRRCPPGCADRARPAAAVGLPNRYRAAELARLALSA